MGLFSSTIAEVTIDFYGQKRRNKVVSNVQVQYAVTISPNTVDPGYLARLYSSFLFKSVDIAVLPTNRELFWTYINESFRNIPSNRSNIFYLWPQFVDVQPILCAKQGKANTTVNFKLLDNGKTKYNISENSVGVYYVPLATVALMQYIISVLPMDQFQLFYEDLKKHILEKKMSMKKPTPYNFDLWDLMPLDNQV